MPERAHALYDEMLAITVKRVQETAKRGIDPVYVAKAVHHALSASRPRTRYRVGTDARIVRALTWLLPDRAMDWVLYKMYGYDALLR